MPPPPPSRMANKGEEKENRSTTSIPFNPPTHHLMVSTVALVHMPLPIQHKSLFLSGYSPSFSVAIDPLYPTVNCSSFKGPNFTKEMDHISLWVHFHHSRCLFKRMNMNLIWIVKILKVEIRWIEITMKRRKEVLQVWPFTIQVGTPLKCERNTQKGTMIMTRLLNAIWRTFSINVLWTDTIRAQHNK